MNKPLMMSGVLVGLPLWAEIGYELAERRMQYQNDQLFAEENQ